MMSKALLSSKSQTWNTPLWFIKLVVRVFGRIQLDPCSNRWSVVGAVRELMKERGEDGLALLWAGLGLVFVNPPFGCAIGAFMRKCAEADECIALVPARSDAAWFHDACDTAAVVILWRGRFTFRERGRQLRRRRRPRHASAPQRPGGGEVTKHYDTAEIKRRAPIDEVLEGYGVKVKKDGARLVACCPFHDDKTPSFVVDPKKALWKCHGPCDEGGDVIKLVMKKDGVTFLDACRKLAERYGIAAQDDGPQPRKKVADYVYTDEAGAELYRIERWEPGKNGRNKDFVQRLPSGEAKKSERQVLYRLHELTKAPAHEVVFVVEGEKCVEALTNLGLVATSAAGGTGAWRTWTKDFASALAARIVIVIPDNDEGGRKLATHVAGVVQAAGASEVRWLELPVTRAGDDVVDWIREGHGRAELLELAQRAPAASKDTEWRATLLRTATGEVRPTVGNAMAILENESAFRGAFWFHERELAVYTDRALPWDKPGTKAPRQVTDDDPVFGAAWCEKTMRAPVSAECFGKALWALARQRRRDPLVDWLRSLRWDKQPRCETWLIKHAAAKDTPYVRAVSKAWLISAVARAVQPGCKVDHVLVLEGEQGLKKSSMLAALAGDGGFADNIPDVDSKDTALILGRTWILELGELESMRKSEVTQMNAFVTRTHDVFRPPYDRTTIVAPRRCVFAATTNDDAYLRDPTGARRWWPVKCGAIAFAALTAEREQLWAEAVAAYDAGTPWWFTDTEIVGLAKEETALREQIDPWEDKIAAYVEGLAYASPAECLNRVGVDTAKQDEAAAKRIGRIMRRLKWERRQHRVGKRREWRFYPPGSGPPDGPLSPVGGGGGGTGDNTGDTVSPMESPVSPVSPVNSLARARAHVQATIDFKSRFPGKFSENTGDTGDTGDTTQPNAEKLAKTVTGPVTGADDATQQPVTAAEVAEMQAHADAMWTDGGEP